MKNHIILKFLAVFLCAASLLGAVGSGLAVFAMTEMGLRDRTLEEAYAASVESTAEALASELAARYAARELGNANESLLDHYYGSNWLNSTFDWDQVGYTIRDEGRSLLESFDQKVCSGSPATYVFTQEGRYLNVLNVMTHNEYNALRNPVTEPVHEPTEPSEGPAFYNMVPAEGSKISYIHVYYADGQFGDYEAAYDGYLGQLSYYAPDQLWFQVQSDYADVDRLFDDFLYRAPVSMSFMNPDGEIVLDISSPDGVLEEFSKNHGNAYFVLRPLDEAAQTEIGSIYDAIDPEGQTVARVSITYADGYEESVGGVPGIGFIGYDEDGYVIFTADYPYLLEFRTEHVTYISFHDENDNLVYEASDFASVGRFYLEEDTLTFRAREDIADEHTPSVSDEGIFVYDDVPPGGYAVFRMELWLEGAARGFTIEGSEGHLGLADHDSNGNVVFTAKNWQDFVFSKPASVVYILMESEEGRLLFEARQEGVATGSGCPIGTFAYDEEGALVFRRGEAAPASAAMAMEVPAPVTDAAEETIPVSDPVNIHLAPHLDSTVVDIMEAGTPVEILDTQVLNGQEWGKVDGGWILLSTGVPATDESVPVNTESTEETAEPEATEVTEPSEAPETVPATTAPVIIEETQPSTVPPYAMDAAEETLPASTDPYDIAVAADKLQVFGYYDTDTGEHMIAEYTYEPMPPYTVEIVLGPGALQYQYEWVLMEQVYGIKDLLIPIFVVSLLLFAITAVYLCCSAGRKPGSDLVRAGGLNCISLDLYLAAAVGGVVCCAFAVVEGGDYLLRQDIQTGILFVLLFAYAACLLAVGFCFAFAAQVKTPEGYWWRNSLCGRSMKIIAWLWNKFVDLCGWLWDKFIHVVGPALLRLLKATWKLTKFFYGQLKKACMWLLEKLVWGWRWLMRNLARFFSMLPLTWQFLVTGFCLVVFLYIMIRTYKVGYILIGFGVFFGVILYAASAFGILLENAKRMRKGDLDSKVDDKLLVGGFRDFAEELNGLADVAVVAAQKQLKSERMKTELITNVSHDIKTPLTSIINYVDLMEKPHSPQEQAAYLEVLSRQSQRLKKLIDDLMEMSKASTGNMAVDIMRVDAGEAVNQALGEFADKLERAQLIPVFRQPEKDICMMADGRLVWRVLSNILSNAVKYALPGTRVYIDLMELDGKVVLSLKNISRDPLNVSAEDLMERFVRGDSARNTEGSGLGLNIAQSLMELQKGKLELLVDGDLFKVTLIFPGA